MKRLALILAIVLLVAAVAVGVLVNQKSGLNSDLSKAKSDYETKEKALVATQTELEEKATTLQTELDSKTQELTTLTEKADGLQKKLDEAVASLETSKTDADNKVAELMTMVDTATTDLGAMRTTADALTQENETLKAQSETTQARVKELEGLLATAETERDEALARETEFQKLHEEAMADRDSLEAELEALKKDAPEAPADSQPITVTKQGEIGPVAVTVTFDQEGAITALEIGDDQFKETTGLGAKAREEGFINQFIGKVPPLKYRAQGETDAMNLVDAITGATGTSNAVIDAINEAYKQFNK